MMTRRWSSRDSEVGHSRSVCSDPVVRGLLSDLDPVLLRSVSLSECLSGFGQYLDSKRTVQRQLSQASRKFQAFISHDWGTSRWLKLGCLLILFNSRAAVVGAVLASAILGVLCWLEVLPYSDFLVMAGHAVFLLLMCFWQRILDVCSGSPRIFLDKLCISQADPEKKKLGILGLGAFLKVSEKLVILWSPRYLNRMWCTYEMVTFLRFHSEAARIQIMPVNMALILVLTVLMCQCVLFSGHFLMDSIGDPVWFPVSLVLVLLEVLVLGPLYNYQGLQIFADIKELPNQLSQFKLQHAECTCCSLGHRDPDTGERIQCDRQLVLSTLQQWHRESEEPDGSEDRDAFLEWFNCLVQSRLLFQGNAGGDMLLLADYAIFALGANIPWVISTISDIMRGPDEPLEGSGLFIWTSKQVLDHAMIYMLTFTFMHMNMLIWKYVAPLMACKSRKALALTLMLPQAVLGTIAWLPWWLLLQQTAGDSLAPILAFLQLLIIDVLIFIGFRQDPGTEKHGLPSAGRAVGVGEERSQAEDAEAELGTEIESNVSSFVGVADSVSCFEEDVKWSSSADFFSI